MSASVRLLVFGGTGFIERFRVGEWPTFPAGMLSDTYGLATGGLSIGVGVRDDNPFIVYRESQQHRERAYPYWLLLDPADGVWQRFAWNGPSILAALSRTALWERLRQEPELIDPTDVRERIQGLTDGPRQTASVVPDSFIAFLVGAGEEGSAVSVCSPLTSIGTHVESFDELASILETRPPAFRVARGWLMGGASAHAKELGCAAVIDPRSLPDAGTEAITRGRMLLNRVDLIQRSSRSEALGELLAEPLFRWPAEVIPLLGAFADLVSGTEARIVWPALDLARVPPKLAYDFIQASLGEPVEARHYSSERTQFLVDRMLADDLPPTVDLGRWDLRTVAVALANRSIAFDRFLAKTNLPSDLLLELWGHYCSSVSESSLLSTLKALVGLVDEQMLTRFLDAALNRVTTEMSLEAWAALDLPASVSTNLHSAIHRKAVSRAIARHTGWERDFILFGGNSVTGDSVPPLSNRDVCALVGAALNINTTHGRQEATDFLSSLARTPSRTAVPVGLKRAVAARAPSAWRDFCALLDLWDGRPFLDKGIIIVDRVSLFSELGELIREYHDRDDSPNLEGLVAFLGSEWPSETVTALKACHPCPDRIADAHFWLAGWRVLDRQWADLEEARIRKAVIRRILDHPQGAASVDDIRRLSKAEIAGCAHDYLAAGSTPDEAVRRAANVIGIAELHATATAAFDLFLHNESRSEESNFVEAMFHDPALLAETVAAASQNSLNDLLSAMVRSDQDAFSELLIDHVARSSREPQVRPMVSKIASYVTANEPNIVRRLTRSMFGGDARECRAVLDRLRKGKS